MEFGTLHENPNYPVVITLHCLLTFRENVKQILSQAM